MRFWARQQTVIKHPIEFADEIKRINADITRHYRSFIKISKTKKEI